MSPKIRTARYCGCIRIDRIAKPFLWMLVCLPLFQFTSCIGILYGYSHAHTMKENPEYRYTAQLVDAQQNPDAPFEIICTKARGRFENVYIEFKLNNITDDDYILHLDSFSISDVVDAKRASPSVAPSTYSALFIEMTGLSGGQPQFMEMKNDSESHDPANNYIVGDKEINVRANASYTGRVYFRLQTREQALKCTFSIISAGSDKPLATKVLLERVEINSK